MCPRQPPSPPRPHQLAAAYARSTQVDLVSLPMRAAAVARLRSRGTGAKLGRRLRPSLTDPLRCWAQCAYARLPECGNGAPRNVWGAHLYRSGSLLPSSAPVHYRRCPCSPPTPDHCQTILSSSGSTMALCVTPLATPSSAARPGAARCSSQHPGGRNAPAGAAAAAGRPAAAQGLAAGRWQLQRRHVARAAPGDQEGALALGLLLSNALLLSPSPLHASRRRRA